MVIRQLLQHQQSTLTLHWLARITQLTVRNVQVTVEWYYLQTKPAI